RRRRRRRPAASPGTRRSAARTVRPPRRRSGSARERSARDCAQSPPEGRKPRRPSPEDRRPGLATCAGGRPSSKPMARGETPDPSKICRSPKARVSVAESPLRLAIRSVEFQILRDQTLPAVAVVQQARLVIEQFFTRLGGELAVRSLDDGVHRAGLL